MNPTRGRRAVLGFVLVASAGIGAATMVLAQESALVKPLDQYLIGDIFPRTVTEASAETGRSWRLAATELSGEAQARGLEIANAITAKRADVQAAKQELREAKRQRDLVRIGTLEGTVKNEELLLDILEDLADVSEKQTDLALAWGTAGGAMERYLVSDNAFDPFRTRRLTRSEAGAPDERLGPDGVQAIRAHAQSMRELGDAFHNLGERTRSLAKERMRLLETLGKGGHLQAGR
jgi:hypothetical protein